MSPSSGVLVICGILVAISGANALPNGTEPDATIGLEREKYSIVEGSDQQVCVEVISGNVVTTENVTVRISDEDSGGALPQHYINDS